MSPATVFCLVVAVCLAVLDHEIACYISLALGGINQAVFTWASKPEAE